MTTPKRIQRRRTKGWRMPEGAVYVGRGSRWGNPYTVERRWLPVAGQVWTLWASDAGPSIGNYGTAAAARASAVQRFRMWVTAETVDASDHAAAHVRLLAGLDAGLLLGRDLACWCPLDHACHADVLLQLAAERGQR